MRVNHFPDYYVMVNLLDDGLSSASRLIHGTSQTVKTAQAFALNMLGKDQKSLAFTFFRPADVSVGKLSGQSFRKGTTGAPILVDVPGRLNVGYASLSGTQ